MNTSPTHAHHRYVINFQGYPLCRKDLGELWEQAEAEQRREWLKKGIVPLDYPEPVAADWPELNGIVAEKVKPLRMKDNRASYRRYWWQYAEKRADLYPSVAGLPQVLGISRVGQHAALTFLPSSTVYAETLIIFPFAAYAAFCTLQSRPHEVWTRFFASSLEERLRYTPSDCFETFPFPYGWETHPDLEAAGRAYFEHRATLMVRNDDGMTKTYNAFTIRTRMPLR